MGLTTSTFKHAAVYGSAAALGRLGGFILLPIYAHAFGTTGYGVIGMINLGLELVLSLLGRGLNAAMLRVYHEEDGPRKNTVITTGVILVAGGSFGLAALGSACSVPLSRVLLGDGSSYLLFCLAFAALFLELTGGAASSLLEIRQQSSLFAVVNVVRLVISLSLNVYLIVVLRMGLLGYFIANLVTVAIATSMLLVICFRSCGFGFDRELARGLVKFQYPLISSSLVAWVGSQIEKVIVRYRIGIDGVGLLALAARFPTLIGLLVMEPFMRSWNTKRTELAERDPANAAIVIGAMYSYFLYVLLFASLLLAVNADTILRLMAPSEFWPAARFVRLYVVSGLLAASAAYLNLGLFMAKATKALARIRTWASAIGVVLSYVFITRWGLDGAVYAGLITTLIILPWTVIASQRRFRIAVQLDKVVFLVVFAAVLYVVIAHGPVKAVPGVERLARFFGSEVAEWVSRTPLAHVRDGAVLKIVKDRGEDVALLIVKTVLCLTFGLLAPVVRGSASVRALRWLEWARGWSRS